MKIISVVGARPNFMKIAPILKEMKRHKKINSLLVHTGQHYDANMSKLFFDDLELPKPDIYLGVGSGSHGEQTARIMVEFEKALIKEKPDLVMVVGDVNSTIACALAAVKLNIKVAHVEAGLRSFDRTMPEEINRVLTDAISDYLFITEKDAEANLLKEGIAKQKIFFVGNVMIDTLLQQKAKAEKSAILSRLKLQHGRNIDPYAVLTLHRPSNVDNKEALTKLFLALSKIQKHIKIVYPSHPRTQRKIKEFNIDVKTDGGSLIMTEPLGYLDFLKLMSNAKLVLTDSGGIQEETTVLGVPCITLRKNTERPVTVTEGTNIMVGDDTAKMVRESLKIIRGKQKHAKIPRLWDGKAAERIIKILLGKNVQKYTYLVA